MTANELRKKYLDFFKQKGHAIISSASLIPQNDPTVLFTTAGMHPLVPYLLGQKHPMGSRLADAQKCVRTGDIDDVGDNRHLTFFEMLGNWSLGDYFKREAIEWSFEFLTDEKWLGLDAQRLYVTVFMGDENAGQDDESMKIWREQFAKAGIGAKVCAYGEAIAGDADKRIFLLPAKDNWWGPAGQTGPCGPCTEMFYDVAPYHANMQLTFDKEVEAGRIMEIWNDVFMEFNKTTESKFEKLLQKNVDTGMGLERTIAMLNGKDNSFESELFYQIIQKIEELSGEKYREEKSPLAPPKGGELPLFREGGGGFSETRAMRIITDHVKAAAFILAEGLEPSNTERGYVLRRLIRRAVRYGKQLGINEIFTFKIANVVVEMYRDVYPELHENRAFIEEQLVREEEKFAKTLERGLKQFESQKSKVKSQNFKSKVKIIPGQVVFDLYQSYGFPVELIQELAREDDFAVDMEEFRELFATHQQISRAGAEQKFKGGLADHSKVVTKYHTATHLLLAALRQVLGEHVYQKGSNITAERLRFDFSHPQKLTPDKLNKIEYRVNEKIKEDLSVSAEEMNLDEAKALGAIGVFESRYGDKVTVYTIGKSGKIYSREICGGPHAERTGLLGRFRIIKEEAVSAGVRRIKAVLE